MTTPPPNPEALRAQHRAALKRLTQTHARRAEAVAAAAEERDAYLIQAHGDRVTGGLSYDEMAEVANISKGRVIQIVQGKSEYSKAQIRAARKAARKREREAV